MTILESIEQHAGAGGRELALVVQGGGMRGVYSMGALWALEERGLSDSFDVVIGSSAGAINGAYLLAGQAQAAVDVYVEYLSNKHFVNFLRLNRVVDIDYLVDDVLKVKCALDIKAIQASRSLLEVVLTHAETGKAHVVSGHDPDLDLYEVIRATAALPGLYNRKISIGGQPYIDGGVADGVPVVYAAETGAKRILSVLTRSPGFRKLDAHPVQRQALKLLAAGQSPAIKAMMGRQDLLFNQAMNLMEGKEQRDGLHVWSVWPSDTEKLVGRTTSDKQRLRQCAEMGRQDMHKTLDGPEIG